MQPVQEELFVSESLGKNRACSSSFVLSSFMQQKRSFVWFSSEQQILLFADVIISEVYVSQNSDASTNTEQCLTQPHIYKCKSLGYVIKTILQMACVFVESIIIEDQSYLGVQDEVVLPFGIPTTGRHFTITCTEYCILTGHFSFVSQSFHPTLHISFHNVHFNFTTLTVQNIHLEFISLNISNSTVTDAQPRAGEKGEVWLTSSNITYNSGKLSVGKVFSSHILFSNCVMGEVKFLLQATYLWFSVNNTKVLQSHFDMNVNNFTSVKITNCLVQFSTPEKVLFFVVSTRSLRFHLADSKLYGTMGGIFVNVKQSFFISSWLHMTMIKCTFQNLTNIINSGGCLNIEYNPPNNDRDIQSFVQIVDTTFRDNK